MTNSNTQMFGRDVTGERCKMADTRSRREFLAGAAAGAGLALFDVVPASALGRDQTKPAPSNRIVVGCIGVGGQGNSNLGAFLNESEALVVAVCDVDKNHLRDTKSRVDGHYSNKDCMAYSDFRELIA